MSGALVHLRAEVIDAKRSNAFNPERMVMGGSSWILRSGRRAWPGAARRLGQPDPDRAVRPDPAAAAAAERLDEDQGRARAAAGVIPRLVGQDAQGRDMTASAPGARPGPDMDADDTGLTTSGLTTTNSTADPLLILPPPLAAPPPLTPAAPPPLAQIITLRLAAGSQARGKGSCAGSGLPPRPSAVRRPVPRAAQPAARSTPPCPVTTFTRITTQMIMMSSPCSPSGPPITAPSCSGVPAGAVPAAIAQALAAGLFVVGFAPATVAG